MQSVIEQLVYEIQVGCFFYAENGGDFMAVKNKIVNIKVFFDGDQDSSKMKENR